MKAIAKLLFFVISLCAIVTHTGRANPKIFEALSPKTQGVLFTISNLFWKPDLHKLLQETCKTRSFEQLLAAIKAGADVNATTTGGFTVLARAMILEYVDHRVVLALIKAGAALDDDILLGAVVRIDSNSPNRKDEIHPDVITALLEAGADVNCKDWKGCTVLMKAIIANNSLKIIKLLLVPSNRVNDVDIGGATALMLAAEQYKEPKIIEALLAAGADPKIEDYNGKTAIDYAAKNEKASYLMYQALSDTRKK